MNSTTSVPAERIDKFFELIRTHPDQIIRSSIIVALVLYISVNVGLAEVVMQNSYPTYMLDAEMLIEHGPDYADESKKYAELIEQYYTKHLEKRDYLAMLRILYPSISPQKVLAFTKVAAERAAEGNEEEAKNTIQQAGKAINQLYLLSERFPRSPFVRFKFEKLPERLMLDLNDTLVRYKGLTRKFERDLNNELFYEVIDKLEKDMAVEDALTVCDAYRRTMLLAFLDRLGYACLGYNDQVNIDNFNNIVKKDTKDKKYDKEFTNNGLRKELLSIIFLSENRRLSILDAILDNDMYIAYNLMWKEIEETYHIRMMVLEICSNLCFVWIKTFLNCFFRPNVYNISAYLRKTALERNRFLNN